jgi:hypothetical protein
MARAGGSNHSPEDHHLTLCEVISSRLRVPCVTDLIIELLLEVDQSDIDALLAENHEEI